MSFFGDLFGGGDSGPDPNMLRLLAINTEIERRRQEQEAIAQENERQRLASLDAANQQAITTAQSTNPLAPSTPTDSSSPAVNPFTAGFENTYVPSTLTDPFEASAATAQRGNAQALIDAMVKRGTLTGTGASKATDLLNAQDASVRSRLNDIGNTLLENERAKVRGIGAEASGASDFAPYTARAAQEASSFQAGLPDAFKAAIPSAGLYDTSGLASGGGAVAGPQTAAGQVDPYAQSGGQLSTGLEAPTDTTTKKRTTAVF